MKAFSRVVSAKPKKVTTGMQKVSTNCVPRVPSTELLANTTIFTESLTGGTIVQGNFVDPNSFSYTKTERRRPYGYCSTREVYDPCTFFLSEWTGPLDINGNFNHVPALDFPSDVYNLALTRFNEKSRGTLDLSVALFEAGKTAKMVNVIKRIRNYTTTSGWRALIRGASNARAEYTFGWKPLIGDLYGVLDESQNIILDGLQAFKARASQRINKPLNGTSVLWNTSWPTTAILNGKHACEINCTLKTGGFDISRWMSLNPISWAYELTPYSFVLDYVINVGGYLRNLETSLLYNNSFVSGYVSKLTAYNSTFSLNKAITVKGSPARTFTVKCDADGRYINFVRTKLTSYPVPDLPSFSVDLGSNQLFNLAALLGQRLKG